MGERAVPTGSSGRKWLSLLLLVVLLAALAAFLYWQYTLSQQASSQPTTQLESDLIFGGEPRTREPVTILRNQRYIVGYSESRKDPLWVAYRLTGGNHAAAPRPHTTFAPDTRTRARVATQDYTNSGYDRGHMAPSHSIGVCFGPEAQLETFLMSNICPQLHSVNAGTWEALERDELDRFAQRFGQVWIFDGPIFDDRPESLRAGIQVPKAFYKIIVEDHRGHPAVLAFIMPQSAPHSDPPEKYLTSVQHIESATGVDFLYLLPKPEEDQLESLPAPALW